LENEPIMQTIYRVAIEQEEDGRFLAEVIDLPGVLAYGDTADLALAHVQALALRVLADRLEHDEGPRGPVSVRFEASAAA
jgi:predicted RNase H-like HicB family nuclease